MFDVLAACSAGCTLRICTHTRIHLCMHKCVCVCVCANAFMQIYTHREISISDAVDIKSSPALLPHFLATQIAKDLVPKVLADGNFGIAARADEQSSHCRTRQQ